LKQVFIIPHYLSIFEGLRGSLNEFSVCLSMVTPWYRR